MPKLTPNAISRLAAGDKLSDPDTTGLYIQANADGSRSFRYLRRMASRHGGALIKRTLGSYGDYSIPDAQEWASALNAKIARGINPVEEERAAAEAERIEAERIKTEATRKAMTVQAAFDLYIADVTPTMDKRTVANKLSRWRTDLKDAIGSKPITEVEHDDLQAIIDAKYEARDPKRGTQLKSASNHLVVDLKAFFRWCVREGKSATGLKFNPSADIFRRSKNVKRQRCFAPWELRLFIRALAEANEFDRRIMLLLTLSGVRVNNAINAHALEWERDTGAWSIERTKNDEPHVVPLGGWGRSFFEGRDGYLFWHPTKKMKDGSVGGVMTANTTAIVRRINKLMQAKTDRLITPWVAHDLRRLISTNLRRLQVVHGAVEAILGHTEAGISGVYNMWRYLPERTAALALWEGELIRIAAEEGVADRLGIPALVEPVREAA